MSECIDYKDQGKEMGANRSKYVRQKNWQQVCNVHKATRVQQATSGQQGCKWQRMHRAMTVGSQGAKDAPCHTYSHKIAM